ncbi:transposase [Streptomyces pimonensis]|uniref:Transposase n=1 Tax=Streptomyces pimonensis TaxID=2860288 RepID=A0ABV4J5E8_9ACTN
MRFQRKQHQAGSNCTKRYTAEFKRNAAALVDSTGRTVIEVARELGVSPESLRNRYRQAKVDQGEGRPGEPTGADPSASHRRPGMTRRVRPLPRRRRTSCLTATPRPHRTGALSLRRPHRPLPRLLCQASPVLLPGKRPDGGPDAGGRRLSAADHLVVFLLKDRWFMAQAPLAEVTGLSRAGSVYRVPLPSVEERGRVGSWQTRRASR